MKNSVLVAYCNDPKEIKPEGCVTLVGPLDVEWELITVQDSWVLVYHETESGEPDPIAIDGVYHFEWYPEVSAV